LVFCLFWISDGRGRQGVWCRRAAFIASTYWTLVGHDKV
jgi:hypothetical protein